MEKRMNKKQLQGLIAQLGIDKKEFMVVSSAALVLRGLFKSAGDLDIAVTKEAFDILNQKYNLIRKENGWYIVNDKVECVIENKENWEIEVYNGYQLESLERYFNYLRTSTRQKDKIKYEIVNEELEKRNLRVEEITFDDCLVISNWKYNNEYSIYNFPGWEKMKGQKWALTDEIKRKKEFRKVVDLNNNIIGYFRVKLQGNKAILGLGKNPNYCGNGKGKIFIKTILQYINQDTIELEVRSFNKRAITCYKNVGFKEINKVKKETSNGKDEFVIMEYKK